MADPGTPPAELEQPKQASERPSSMRFLSRQELRRTDLQVSCIIAVVASTAFAASFIILGTLILVKRHAVPAFMRDKCMTLDFINVQWPENSSMYMIWHYAIPSTAQASLVFLLLINLLLTSLLAAHDRIGSTSLIWLLHEESGMKPKFNTNGRMISGTKSFGEWMFAILSILFRLVMYKNFIHLPISGQCHQIWTSTCLRTRWLLCIFDDENFVTDCSGPCHGIINAIAAVSTSFCYGAAANMFKRFKVAPDCSEDLSATDHDFDGAHYGIDVSGWPLFIIGLALMIQNVLSIWTLFHMLGSQRVSLHSWSLDPVVNSIFMITSLNDKREAIGSSKLTARQSLHEQVVRARVLIRVVWATFAMLVAAVALSVYFGAVSSGFSAQNDLQRDIWQDWGFAYTVLGMGSKTTDWAGESVTSWRF